MRKNDDKKIIAPPIETSVLAHDFFAEVLYVLQPLRGEMKENQLGIEAPPYWRLSLFIQSMR